MARSTCIYTVFYGASAVAAFTVKHELVTWLKHPSRSHCSYTVVRLPDGGAGASERWLDVEALRG